jgi:hypothetical protein
MSRYVNLAQAFIHATIDFYLNGLEGQKFDCDESTLAKIRVLVRTERRSE